MEWRLHPEGEVPHVSTLEFHADRERAPHVDQAVHQPRLMKAMEFILEAAHQLGPFATLSDLGCGDGGLLQMLKGVPTLRAWGYDWHPASREGWVERGVTAYALDVFSADREAIVPGDISVCTEVLEHLADPNEAVRWLAGASEYLVASSPHTETDLSHDACHAWAWDMPGYQALLEDAGWRVLRHEPVGMFQVILARAS